MRVKGSSASRNKQKKLYSITKGFWGRKKNVYRRAREAYLHALTSAFAGRKLKKRDFRKLWIVRINAAARVNGIAYSALINGLKRANITINRKMLADLAVNDAPAFAQLVEKARAAL
ncbi:MULTISPECIES: 50S ribosomal protein L20 [Cloacibacillus]|nr:MULTISPECIES: 50S ribosomal protein L20 [Cloacibacillus]MDD7648380.1 50S ribosomal protein L20 [Cloacibacillus porcorum]MDY4092606.1 50S ribosomal protein L20 [Cloacibacillus porcorum]MDY5390902.1 50S ribosomal protein L20 [Cloacibacillus porcorum]